MSRRKIVRISFKGEKLNMFADDFANHGGPMFRMEEYRQGVPCWAFLLGTTVRRLGQKIGTDADIHTAWE
jgi:hypothetical protein